MLDLKAVLREVDHQVVLDPIAVLEVVVHADPAVALTDLAQEVAQNLMPADHGAAQMSQEKADQEVAQNPITADHGAVRMSQEKAENQMLQIAREVAQSTRQNQSHGVLLKSRLKLVYASDASCPILIRKEAINKWLKSEVN